MDDDQKMAGEKKNKGGRPKKKEPYYNRKVTIYLSDQEHELLSEFANLASYSLGISAAARILILNELRGWVKGKKRINLYGKYE
jgi:hypothetical protein